MQLSHELYLLVTCLTAFSGAIRVDWNTNTGPIVPPTPRTTVRPQPPFREPAPVWEDQSNDIPNPNPYVYVLPPPSRPRPATNNYLTSDRQPIIQTNYNNNNYGSIVSPSQVNSYLQQHGNTNAVPSLAVKYIPNVGNKYYAVVPGKGYYPGNYYNSNIDKLQGKYNAKTKKYKVYEKVKYAPQTNYFPLFHFEYPQEQSYEQQFNQQLLLETLQLPLAAIPAPFRVESEFKQQQQSSQQQQQEQEQQQKKRHQQEQQQQQQQQQKQVATHQKFAHDKVAADEKSHLLNVKYGDKLTANSISKNSILS